MTIISWLVIAFVSIAAFLSGIGYFFANKIVRPRTCSLEKSYEIEVEKGKLIESDYLSWRKFPVSITVGDGIVLKGTYFPIDGAQKTMVLSHGFTYTRYGMVKYIPMFRRLGFNVLIYDLRFHGESTGPAITFGLLESRDLISVFDWCLDKLGPEGVVGSMGESMGAVVALQHALIDHRPAFVIADCSFSDLTDMLLIRVKEDFHLPGSVFLPLAEIFCRKISGLSFTDVSPIRSVQEIHLPVLFAHSQFDRYIPVDMSEKLYAAKKRGPRKLYIAPNGDHVEAYWKNQDAYFNQVETFLREIGIIEKSS